MIALHIIAMVFMMIIVAGLSVVFALMIPNFCEHKTTIKLSSIQKQICADCNARLDWPLKDGQQPLVSSSRDKRRK
jgi:hypothetical protein